MTTESGRISSERIVAFDGLRAIAVLVVLIHHAALLPGGYLGVDLFFVLSGFLITGLLLDEIERTGTLSLRRFWVRRLVRLMPAVVAFLIAGVVLAFVMKSGQARTDVVADAGAAVLGLKNWLAVATGRSSAWSDHLWSLSVEQQFYLLWPLALLLLMRSRWRDRAVRVVLGLVVLVVMWRATVVLAGWNTGLRWYLGTDMRADALLVGAGLAFLWRRGTLDRVPPRAWRVGSTVAAVAFAGAVLASPGLGEAPTSNWLAYGGFTVVAVIAAVLVGSVVADPGGPVARVLSWRPAVWLGGISYAFYLWHYPVIVEVADVVGPRYGPVAACVVAFVISAVLAQASMWFVERPARRVHRRLEVRRSMRPALTRAS